MRNAEEEKISLETPSRIPRGIEFSVSLWLRFAYQGFTSHDSTTAGSQSAKLTLISLIYRDA